MDISAINSSSLQTTLLVVLAVLAILVAVDKGVSAFNNLFRKGKAKQTDEQNKRLQDIENSIKEHKARLDKGDTQFASVSCDMTHLLEVQNALLMHEITGNNIDKLKSVKSDLDSYLASRKWRNP